MSRHYRAPIPFGERILRDHNNSAIREREASKEAKRASILHLLDLKRAGHSPTKTELDIPHDGCLPVNVRGFVPYGSLMGSPGAMAEGA